MTSQSPRLRAMFCDHLSIMRGKYLPASKMKDDESRFARPTFAVHYDKDLLIEAPIPHTDPVTMTQALNDSLATQVRLRPEQWFWVHRRWRKIT